MKYDVFISYSRKDAAVAERICDAFDRAGINYFIDRQGISGGFDFLDLISKAILESNIILFLASNNSYSSKFTISELTYAFKEKPKNSILPYIIDGSTMPGDLCLLLSSINWRTIEKSPVDTVLVDDVLDLIGRKRQSKFEEKTWKVGDYYNINGKAGVVFWVDETGRHGKIVSMDQEELQWCTDNEYYESKLTGIATDESDGMKNLQSIMKITWWKRKFPAFAWCANHGTGWYLPARIELRRLLKKALEEKSINRMLVQYEGSEIRVLGGYWSSSEYNNWAAHSCSAISGGGRDKCLSVYVRAVSAF